LVPEYVSSAGDEAIALAAMGGLILDEWQELVLRHSLGERQDGKWAAFEVALITSRQSGKNSCLEARELAEVYLVSQLAGPRLVLHSAHRFDTSVEHFRRMENRISESPELLKRVKHRGSKVTGFMHAHGDESIEFEDGSRIIFAARTRGGRRGFTADLLVFDESMEFPEDFMAAVVPTVSAKTGSQFLPGPQMWFTGSAVDQQKDPHGIVLARLRERGIKAEPNGSLAFFEWSADDDADPNDPLSWAQANPGLGIRITAEHIALEKASMPPRGFAVERLGIGDWPSTDPESERVISAQAWADLADPGSRITGSPTFALDVDPDQSWCTISAAGEREDGLYHVGVVEHRRGTEWVAPHCAELLKQFGDADLVIDPRSESHALLPDLEDAGVFPTRVGSADYAEACGGFFLIVSEKRLRYMPPQPELDAAVAGARTAPLLDAWKWSRRNSSVLITPLVSVTLALWGARSLGAPQVWSLSEIVANMQRDTEGTPEPTVDAVVPADTPVTLPEAPAGTRFVSLEDMPSQGRWR
jgi:hypothetical protein